MIVFRKKLMLERLKKENLLDSLTDDIKKKMDELDGKEVIKNGWKDLIYDTLEYIAKDDMGNNYPINANDVEVIYPKQKTSKDNANKERTDR